MTPLRGTRQGRARLTEIPLLQIHSFVLDNISPLLFLGAQQPRRNVAMAQRGAGHLRKGRERTEGRPRGRAPHQNTSAGLEIITRVTRTRLSLTDSHQQTHRHAHIAEARPQVCRDSVLNHCSVCA